MICLYRFQFPKQIHLSKKTPVSASDPSCGARCCLKNHVSLLSTLESISGDPTLGEFKLVNIQHIIVLIAKQHWSELKRVVAEPNHNLLPKLLLDCGADSEVILRYFT